MKKTTSLDNFMSLAESKYPGILPLISSKNEYSIEFHLPNDGFKTFEESSKVLYPIFSLPVKLPIKKTSVSFIERFNYFKVIVDLI